MVFPRVVGTDGRIRGYAFGGKNVKIKILKREGVRFRGEKVNLAANRWKI